MIQQYYSLVVITRKYSEQWLSFLVLSFVVFSGFYKKLILVLKSISNNYTPNMYNLFLMFPIGQIKIHVSVLTRTRNKTSSDIIL